MEGGVNILHAWLVMRLSYLAVYFVNLLRGSLCNAILRVKYNKCLWLWGMHFRFLSSLLGSVLVLDCSFAVSFSLLSLVLWLGSFSRIILDICERISFLLGFHVVNAVNDAITLYWHFLHSSLSGETRSGDSTPREEIVSDR